MKRPKDLFKPHSPANRIFVNRTNPLSLLHENLHTLEADSSNLLVFYGVGGQGKTALCREFLRQVKESSSKYIKICHVDLRSKSKLDYRLGLLWIRNSLASCPGTSFPAFDLAFALYWTLTSSEGQLPNFEGTKWLPEIENSISSAAEKAGEAAFDVFIKSGTEMVPFVGKILSKLTSWGLKEIRRRYTLSTNAAVKKLFDENGDPLPFEQIEKLLPEILATDIQQMVGRNPDYRFVCLVDEFERTFEQGGISSRLHTNLLNEAFRDLVARCPATLFVVFSRERLPWAYQPQHGIDSSAWAQWIEGAHHLLGGLSRKDAELFLQAIPIPDALVRAALIEGASVKSTPIKEEIYPLFLDLQVNIYFANLRDGILAVPVESFKSPATSFDELRHSLLSRLLRDYGPAAEAMLTRLSVARGFDRKVFDYIARTFHIGVNSDQFAWFAELSFVEPGDRDQEFTIHRLIRQSLVELLTDELELEIHRYLSEYFEKEACIQSGSSLSEYQVHCLTEAVYHRISGNPAEAATWWSDVRHAIFNRFEVGSLVTIERLLIEGCRGADPTVLAEILWHHSNELLGIGQVNEALSAIREALSLTPPSDVSSLPLILLMKLTEATSLQQSLRYTEAELVCDDILDCLQEIDLEDGHWLNGRVLEVISNGLEQQGLINQAILFRKRRLEALSQQNDLYDTVQARISLIRNMILAGDFDMIRPETEQTIADLHQLITEEREPFAIIASLAFSLHEAGFIKEGKEVADLGYQAMSMLEVPAESLERIMFLKQKANLALHSGQPFEALSINGQILELVRSSAAHSDHDLVGTYLNQVEYALACHDIQSAKGYMIEFDQLAEGLELAPSITMSSIYCKLSIISLDEGIEEQIESGVHPQFEHAHEVMSLIIELIKLGGLKPALRLMQREDIRLCRIFGEDYVSRWMTLSSIAKYSFLCGEAEEANRIAQLALEKALLQMDTLSLELLEMRQTLIGTAVVLQKPEQAASETLMVSQTIMHHAQDANWMHYLIAADAVMTSGVSSGNLEEARIQVKAMRESALGQLDGEQSEAVLVLFRLQEHVFSLLEGSNDAASQSVEFASWALANLGERHPIVGILAGSAADYCAGEHQYAKAVFYRRICVENLQAQDGSQSESARIAMAELGRELERAGNPIEGFSWSKKALREFNITSDLEVWWWATQANYASVSAYHRGNLAECERLALEVIEREGVDPSVISSAVRNLISVRSSQEQWDSVLEDCAFLRTITAKLEEGDFERVRNDLFIARVLAEAGQPLQSLRILDHVTSDLPLIDAVDWLKDECGILRLFVWALNQDDIDLPLVSMEQITQSLVVLKEAIGEATHDYAVRLVRVAIVLDSMGEHERALATVREGIQILQDKCGVAHPELVRATALSERIIKGFAL